MRDDQQRLHDILEAIERIERQCQVDRAVFDTDELLQVWAIHHLQIIGEAARSLSDATRQQIPAVPWQQIIGMRHILVHQYFGIDLDAVWTVLVRDLQPLKAAIQTVCRPLQDSAGDHGTASSG